MMFSSYEKCTDVLLNITLSLYSLKTFEVEEPCSTWQEVLTHTLKYDDVDGTFADVISVGPLAAVRPLSDFRTKEDSFTSMDGVLFAFLYLSIFIVYSKCVQHLA